MQKFPLACYVFCLALELLLYLSGQLSVCIGKLWVCCNTGFPPARDNRVFIFYPTARETSGLMDAQEEHAPGRVVLWWHQGFVSTELLTGPRFHSQTQGRMKWDLGVRECWAWEGTRSPKTRQFCPTFTLCLHFQNSWMKAAEGGPTSLQINTRPFNGLFFTEWWCKSQGQNQIPFC